MPYSSCEPGAHAETRLPEQYIVSARLYDIAIVLPVSSSFFPRLRL